MRWRSAPSSTPPGPSALALGNAAAASANGSRRPRREHRRQQRQPTLRSAQAPQRRRRWERAGRPSAGSRTASPERAPPQPSAWAQPGRSEQSQCRRRPHRGRFDRRGQRLRALCDERADDAERYGDRRDRWRRRRDPTQGGVYAGPTYTTALGTTATTVQSALNNETASLTALGNATAADLGEVLSYSSATGAISAPSYSVANIGSGGTVGTANTDTNVGAAITGLSTDVTGDLATALTGGGAGIKVFPRQFRLLADSSASGPTASPSAAAAQP